MTLTPHDLTPASYNPREFTDSALAGLDSSIAEFDDISGITFNASTGNLVTGHHRWRRLCVKYGIDNLKFAKIKGTEKCAIFTRKGVDTGFMVRVVKWSMRKEQLANVTANSPTIEGRFTAKLQGILCDIELSDAPLFDALNLGEIKIAKTKINLGSTGGENKSETVVSGGGDVYKTLRLELSPELANEFTEALRGLREHGKGDETAIRALVDHINNHGLSKIRTGTQ